MKLVVITKCPKLSFTYLGLCESECESIKITFTDGLVTQFLLERSPNDGAPIHWRSNRQARSTLSPAESEIYALSTGVKDSRLIHWTLAEAGVAITWPFTVQADNKAAISFQKDTCPTSKIRGCFDFREKWVKEMKDKDVVRTEHVETHKNLADIFIKCLDKKNYIFKYDMIVNYQDRM